MAEEHAIVKAFPVVVAGGRGEQGKSAQRQVDDALRGPEDTLTPPLPLGAMSRLSSVNGTRRSCIEAISLNTVGLGVDAIRTDPEPKEGDATAKAALLKLLDELSRRDNVLGRPSFVEQMRAVKTDEEECGWGFLEVSRNGVTAKIDGLYHVPGHRMRRRKDRKGYVLVEKDGGQDIEATFVNFGDRVERDAEGNVVTGTDGNPNVVGDDNEVIVFRLYTSESRDYGMPRDAALALEYAADKLAAESNVGFFDSDTVPPTIIFVSGEERKDGTTVILEVPDETIERISESVKPGGPRNRTIAVVPLPSGSKVEKVELARRSDKDIGNDAFRKNIRLRTRQAFRLGPIFVAEDGEGRYDAEVQRALGLEQVFDPEQRKYEDHLQLLVDALGYEGWRLKFKRLAVEGDQARRDSADALATVGTITNAEHRAAHGLGRLPEADTDDPVKAAEEGKVIKGWNDMLVTPPKQAGGAMKPFGGANGGSDFPHPDGRGLRAGLAGRVRQVPGTRGEPQQGTAAVAKGETGVPFVDDAAAAMEVVYLDVTDEAITEALRRTHTVAEVIAGEVATIVDERIAVANGAS